MVYSRHRTRRDRRGLASQVALNEEAFNLVAESNRIADLGGVWCVFYYSYLYSFSFRQYLDYINMAL
jgi:hypothetical protein